MRVAIIDDGIARNSLEVPVRYHSVRNGVVSDETPEVTSISHGTLCAGIALRGIRDVEIECISIYSELEEGREEDLIAALRWCMDHPVDLINMSNGMSSFFHNEALNEACYQLWLQGTVIVAGLSNNWDYTVPAQLPWVTGVSCHRFFHRNRYNPFVRADRRISGFSCYRTRRGGLRIESCNSFACARMTNRLIRKALKRGGQLPRQISRNPADLSLLKSAVVYPENTPVEILQAYSGHTLSDCQCGDRELSLVIADGSDPSGLVEKLNPIARKIGLLLWCDGYMPLLVRGWCFRKGIRYHQRSKRTGNGKRIRDLTTGFEDCFMVAIPGGENRIADVSALKRSFEAEEYSVLLFSNARQGWAYGAFPFTGNTVIRQACDAIRPDVVLVTLPADAETVCDLRIFFSDKRVCLEAERISAVIPRSDAANVFQRIVTQTEAMCGDGEEACT